MDAIELKRAVPKWRSQFRGILSDDKSNDIKSFLKKCLDECGSEFEEQCLIENLKEEFHSFCAYCN